MARITDVINQWGKQSGPNPQRNDLWQVDLSEVIDGINKIRNPDDGNTPVTDFPMLPIPQRYFSASVAFPELKIKSEPVRRDSRIYNMPSWDDALESFKFTFIVDSGGRNKSSSEATQSTIYTILDVWRNYVRAGRGAVGSDPGIVLDKNYRIEYAFPIYVYLAKGNESSSTFTNVQSTRMQIGEAYYDVNAPAGASMEEVVTLVNSAQDYSDYLGRLSGLQVSQILKLENAWLAGFKLGELSYDKTATLTVEATVYADNLLQIRQADDVPSFI